MRTWNAEHGDAVADINMRPCLAAIWFVVHHFWFLDVQVGGLPVRALCQLLLAALAPAVLLPGLIRSAAPKNLISALMLLQVGLASCSADGAGEPVCHGLCSVTVSGVAWSCLT